MRVLKNNGLPHQSLQDVFRATVEAKLLYAAPAWSCFCAEADRFRLNSFLRRCLKLGYRDSDEQLFDRINHNSQHILQQLQIRPTWFEFELQSPQPTPQQDNYMQDFWTEWQILLLEIYTNIAINPVAHDASSLSL